MLLCCRRQFRSVLLMRLIRPLPFPNGGATTRAASTSLSCHGFTLHLPVSFDYRKIMRLDDYRVVISISFASFLGHRRATASKFSHNSSRERSLLPIPIRSIEMIATISLTFHPIAEHSLQWHLHVRNVKYDTDRSTAATGPEVDRGYGNRGSPRAPRRASQLPSTTAKIQARCFDTVASASAKEEAECAC